MFISPPQPQVPGPRGQRITYDSTPTSGAMPGDLYVDPDFTLWQMGDDWEAVGSVRGLPGDDGNPGAAATVEIGAVATGAPGSSASVTNAGTPTAAVLNISIPRGDTGSPGSAAKLVQATTATTNAAGLYTWTFPTPFAATPRVTSAVQSATTDIFDVKIVSVSTTQCTVQIGRTQASVVALLSLTILSVPASVGAQVVHIVAVAP